MLRTQAPAGRRSKLHHALLATLVLLLASAAPATTLIELSDEQLARVAEVIVKGRCTAITTTWRGGKLLTVTTVAVTEVLKGTPPATVEVLLPGGIDLDREIPVAMTFPGAASMSRDEKVVLFLSSVGEAKREYQIIGFSQGKFSIARDETGEVFVRQDLHGATLIGEDGPRRGGLRSLPLELFERRLRHALGQTGAPRDTASPDDPGPHRHPQHGHSASEATTTPR